MASKAFEAVPKPSGYSDKRICIVSLRAEIEDSTMKKRPGTAPYVGACPGLAYLDELVRAFQGSSVYIKGITICDHLRGLTVKGGNVAVSRQRPGAGAV